MSDPNAQAPISLAFVTQVCGKPQTGNKSAPEAGTGSIFVNQQGVSGASHGPGASESQQAVSPDYTTGDTAWDDCFHALYKDHWMVYGQHCAAIKLYDEAQKYGWYGVAAYGIAAAACTVACISEWTGFGTSSRIACTATGAAATINDIVAAVKLSNITEEEQKLHYWGIGTASLGGLGTLTSAGALGASSGNKQDLSCVSAGIFILATSIRAKNIYEMNENSKGECDKLQEFVSKTPLPVPDRVGSTTPPPTDSQSKTLANAILSGASGKGGGNGNKYIGGLTAEQTKALQDYPHAPQFAKATAGDVFSPLLKEIGGLDKADQALQEAAGLNAADLAAKLGSGQSLSQIASQTPALQAAAADMARIEKDLKDGKMSLKSGATLGAYTKPSAPKKAAAAANPFGMFGGMKGPAMSGDAPKDMSFEKAKRDLAATDGNGDIWHEGFNGTIFQIVSQKLGRTRERIDQLEWESPLNRALTGLPAKKPARSTAGVK